MLGNPSQRAPRHKMTPEERQALIDVLADELDELTKLEEKPAAKDAVTSRWDRLPGNDGFEVRSIHDEESTTILVRPAGKVNETKGYIFNHRQNPSVAWW